MRARIAVVAAAVLAICSTLTYPKTVVSFPVSFTIGANLEDREFGMSPLYGWEVEVIVKSGTASWTATIKHQDETIWDHHTSQGGQTICNIGWPKLSSGQYNFTFATAGFGELQADINIAAKGGFW